MSQASAHHGTSQAVPLETQKPAINVRRFCVAPMLKRTDRFCRYFFRQISRHAYLYTEMISTGAILHGDRNRHLYFEEEEHPVAIQLGGSEPGDLARCARIAEAHGYAEVNLNCGCPSERVQAGSFGACLMKEPDLVADSVKAMRDTVSIPITVKCRIGVDDSDHYNFVQDFIGTVAAAGCQTFILHARKAWLKGLSPKQNREIPPLDYSLVYQLKREFPQLEIIINGGITSLDAANEHLQYVDGVMLGREVCQNPWVLANVDEQFFEDIGSTGSVSDKRKSHRRDISRQTVASAMLNYATRELKRGTRLQQITRPMLGLYQGQPNARYYRRYLSENIRNTSAEISILANALDKLSSY